MPKPTHLNPDIGPSAAEFGKWRSFLARNGVSQAQIKAWLGGSRTRREIADELKSRLKDLPGQ